MLAFMKNQDTNKSYKFIGQLCQSKLFILLRYQHCEAASHTEKPVEKQALLVLVTLSSEFTYHHGCQRDRAFIFNVKIN